MLGFMIVNFSPVISALGGLRDNVALRGMALSFSLRIGTTGLSFLLIWLAAQSLPGHGFDPAWGDEFHLLWARSFYNNPLRLRDGWPVRNLTAPEALDAVWRGVTQEQP